MNPAPPWTSLAQPVHLRQRVKAQEAFKDALGVHTQGGAG